MLQFGMTCFAWNPIVKGFTSYAFSFYLFSEPSKLLRLEKRFTFQASSAAFLAENKFDFNKVFYGGIPYLSEAEEKVYREKKGLANGNGTGYNDDQPLALTPENQAFVDEKL